MKKLLWRTLSGRRGLCHAAVTRLGPDTVTEEHTHDFFEMFFVVEGSGLHRRGTTCIPLTPGTLVFVRPEHRHAFATGPGGALVFVNVAVSAAWRRSLATVVELPVGWETGGTPSGHYHLERRPAETLRQLMFSLMEPGPEPDALVRTWVQAIRASQAAGPSADRPPVWLLRLVSEMERPEWMNEDLSFWQKRSGRTAAHLARCCRRYLGAPLNELVNRARIGRVHYLLRTTEEKITTIAFEAGYNNLAHFYRVFQRLSGETPRSWRERAVRSAVPEKESRRRLG